MNFYLCISLIISIAANLPFGCNQYIHCFYGSEMASSFYTYVYSNGQYGRRAYIYFRDDPDYPWGSNYYTRSSSYANLFTAAVHEIGHTLCLGHNDIGSHSESVMSPFVMYYFPNNNLQVPIDSAARSKIKTMYGEYSLRIRRLHSWILHSYTIKIQKCTNIHGL